MQDIPKRIVTDEDMQPIAVQIEYQDWLKIQKLLELNDSEPLQSDLSRHIGRLDWPVDGLEYQHEARREWE